MNKEELKLQILKSICRKVGATTSEPMSYIDLEIDLVHSHTMDKETMHELLDELTSFPDNFLLMAGKGFRAGFRFTPQGLDYIESIVKNSTAPSRFKWTPTISQHDHLPAGSAPANVVVESGGYFCGAHNSVHIGQNIQSPIQAGNTAPSTQNVNYSSEQKWEMMEELAKIIKENIDSLKLPAEDKDKLGIYADRLATIAHSKREDELPVAQHYYDGIKSILQGVASGLITRACAPGVEQAINYILSNL